MNKKTIKSETPKTKNPPRARTIYDRKRVFAKNEKESLTQQSHAESCSIKFLMERFTQTGIAPIGRSDHGQYIEAPEMDFQEAQNVMASLRSDYEHLDAETQANFRDSAEYAAAVGDPSRHAELIALGIFQDSLGDPRPEEQNPDTGDFTHADTAQSAGAEGPSEASTREGEAAETSYPT